MGFFAKMVNDAERSVNPIQVITVLLAVAVIGWGTWEAYHTGHMPTNLSGAAELLGGTGVANLAHKASDIVASYKSTTVTTSAVAPIPPPSAFPTPPPMVAPPQ